MSTPAPGPVLRPLDFGVLMMSKERTHVELGRVVDDLTQWLSVVEVGLLDMLDKTGESIIEEEQDDMSTDKDEAAVHEPSALEEYNAEE
jgi:protein-serine/threonine kinase